MNAESLIRLVLTIAIVGVIAWLIIAFLPLPTPFPQIIIVVLVIAVVLYLLKALGGPTV